MNALIRFGRTIPRATSAARNGDWHGAQAILLAGIAAALDVNEGRSLL